MYRGLLFHPAKFDEQGDGSAPELAGVSGENVSFKNSIGHTLYGWYFVKSNAKYTILLSHGNGGNVSYRADTCTVLLNAGASVLIYDYRGYGRSEGLPTVEGICDDALHAYDFLNRTCGVSSKRIVLYGESLGCSVSSYLSTQRQCAGMILQSGFESLGRIASEIFPLLAIYPGKLLSNPTLDTLAVVRHSHKPLLVVHGCKDQVVPFSHAVDVVREACEPKRFLELPACGHNDLCAVALPEFSAALSDYLLWIDNDEREIPGVSAAHHQRGD
jgi:fermentation-respiration switch protein FrsA (DUF1100 family)